MKRIMMVILMCSLILSCGLSFADLTNENTLKVDALKAIGLFSGSSKGYELNRAPNRIEAAVMLVRLLGKEAEVKANTYTHPFTDLPAWANNYVGYMYTNQLSKGISETEFGEVKLVDANSYATFVLRALGYSDAAGDFAWATALDFAAEKGILTQVEKKSVVSQRFLRDELVLLSYGTLKAPLKDTTKPLIDRLIEEKVVAPFAAVTNGIAQVATYKDSLSGKVSYSGFMKDIDSTLSGVSIIMSPNVKTRFSKSKLCTFI